MNHSESNPLSVTEVGGTKRIGAEDLGKKIFVGGLSPSVESGRLALVALRQEESITDQRDDLRDYSGSQAGDQMQFRGFGYVRFKHAASVSAAVEAHHINIYGKKAEIKGAVPRFELPVLEVSRVDSDTLSDTAMTGNKILDLNEAEVLEVATPGSLCLPKKELPTCNQTSSLAEAQQTTSSESTTLSCLSGFPSAGVCTVSGGTNFKSLIREVPPETALPSFGCPSANVFNVSRDHSVSQSVMRVSSSNSLLGRKPTWLNAFKGWLPDFLSRVSTRELSDFVRSFPELCRMKIVPVGRGPATHMVLLPPMNRNIPSAAGRRNMSNIPTRSLMDGTRSYAEVACHGSAARIGRSDAAPPSNAAFCVSGSNLGHQGMHAGPPAPSGGMTSSTDHQPAFPYGLHQGLSMRGPSTAVAGDNADVKATCDGPPKTSLTYSDGHILLLPLLIILSLGFFQKISPLQAYGDKTQRGSMGGSRIQGSGTETYNSACQLHEVSSHSNESFGTPT